MKRNKLKLIITAIIATINTNISAEILLNEINVSADASKGGLSEAYTGGQIARGTRIGILGTMDLLKTPFSATSYTNELIQDQQAASVGDVLLNDPTVRATRGFGNFQEMYFIRGFPVPSDDMTYNGLYGILPRQYVPTEFVERVDVFRGANTFISGGAGAANGFGVGGMVNIVPKRAQNNDFNRFTTSLYQRGHWANSFDISRRFGGNAELGVRISGSVRDGEQSIKNEDKELDNLIAAFDINGDGYRISADIGHSNHVLNSPRPSVTPTGKAPGVPDSSDNFAQPWSFSKEKATFGTVRAEVDLDDSTTTWLAFGAKESDEHNRLANATSVSYSGDMTAYRFENKKEDSVFSKELGIKKEFVSESYGKHELVASYNSYNIESKNAYEWSNNFSSNIYNFIEVPLETSVLYSGASLQSPVKTEVIHNSSWAIADTMSFMDDNLKVMLGLREQTIKNTNYGYDGIRSDNNSKEDKEVTPLATILYRVNKLVSVYGNYVEALSAGQIAPWNAANSGTRLANYTSEQYEVGIKYDARFFGGSIALFTTDKPFGIRETGSNIFKEGGEQRNRGMELSLFGEPVDNLKLLGGFTYIDSEITKSNDESLKGERAIGVPKYQANLNVDYTLTSMPGLSFNSRVIYTGKQYRDGANLYSIPSWATLDVGAKYITKLGKNDLTLRARLNNVLDKDYWSAAGGYPDQGYLVMGMPRTATLSATLDF